MSESLKTLEHMSRDITNLSDRDLHRLARLIVRELPDAACDLLDGIQGEFALMERELGLV